MTYFDTSGSHLYDHVYAVYLHKVFTLHIYISKYRVNEQRACHYFVELPANTLC